MGIRPRYTIDQRTWTAVRLTTTGGWIHAFAHTAAVCGVDSYGTHIERLPGGWRHDLEYACTACWAAIVAQQDAEITAGRWEGITAHRSDGGWIITTHAARPGRCAV